MNGGSGASFAEGANSYSCGGGGVMNINGGGSSGSGGAGSSSVFNGTSRTCPVQELLPPKHSYHHPCQEGEMQHHQQHQWIVGTLSHCSVI